MSEPDDASRFQLAFHETARLRRQDVVFEWEWVLNKYLAVVLAEEEPLRFSLTAGQPVYNVLGTEMQVMSDTNQPLEVYLDAARLRAFDPFDLLVMGTPTMETFLIRIDFSIKAEFETSIYNRLRLEHVLRSIRESSPIHYGKLLVLYQFRRCCQLVLSSHRYQIPMLEDQYDFYRFL